MFGSMKDGTGPEALMPMTTEQIAAILAGVGRNSDHAAPDKRRRAIRVKHREPVTIIPFQESMARTPLSAMMTDFSSRGVALHLSQAIPAGAHLVLVLQSDARTPVQLLCNVVHCHERSDGKFSIGAEFVGMPPARPAKSDAMNRVEASRISDLILE
jgi:hypothetical protein